MHAGCLCLCTLPLPLHFAFAFAFAFAFVSDLCVARQARNGQESGGEVVVIGRHDLPSVIRRLASSITSD